MIALTRTADIVGYHIGMLLFRHRVKSHRVSWLVAVLVPAWALTLAAAGCSGELDPGEDEDRDGIVNGADPFPTNSSEWMDTDRDGIGNNADDDDDGDGVTDGIDIAPLDPLEWIDTDFDGTGDNADGDDDNDGAADNEDAFPLDRDEQHDTDRDGMGDRVDIDTDGDGVTNEDEQSCGTDPLDDASISVDLLPRQTEEQSYLYVDGAAAHLPSTIQILKYDGLGQPIATAVGYDRTGHGRIDWLEHETTIQYYNSQPSIIYWKYYTQQGGLLGERYDRLDYDANGRLYQVQTESDLIADGHYALVMTSYTYDGAGRIVAELRDLDKDVDGRPESRTRVTHDFGWGGQLTQTLLLRDDGLDGVIERTETSEYLYGLDGGLSGWLLSRDNNGDASPDYTRLRLYDVDENGRPFAASDLEDIDGDGVIDTTIFRVYKYYFTCRP